MTKHKLIALGYGASRAQDTIKRAKLLKVRKGVPYYKSPKLGRVPVTAVEEITGSSNQHPHFGGTRQDHALRSTKGEIKHGCN